MSGFQIRCPDGKIVWADTNPEFERMKVVEDLLSRYQDYC